MWRILLFVLVLFLSGCEALLVGSALGASSATSGSNPCSPHRVEEHPDFVLEEHRVELWAVSGADWFFVQAERAKAHSCHEVFFVKLVSGSDIEEAQIKNILTRGATHFCALEYASYTLPRRELSVGATLRRTDIENRTSEFTCFVAEA